eukprot:8102915-Ditylum_brightwellii.AAC.1
MHWTDIFNDFLHRKTGIRIIILSYVIRAIALALRPASVNKDDLPHGEKFDLGEDELVAQASHTHTSPLS